VKLLRSVYSQFDHLVHEIAKFGVVGAVALVANFISFNVLRSAFPNKVLVATILSTVLATCVAYLGNRYWTYKDRDTVGRGRELVLFFVVNGIAAVIETACVATSHYGFGWQTGIDDNVAKYVFGMPLGMMVRFWSYRTWIFPEAEGLPETAPVPTSMLPAALPSPRHAARRGDSYAATRR